MTGGGEAVVCRHGRDVVRHARRGALKNACLLLYTEENLFISSYFISVFRLCLPYMRITR